MWGPQPTGGWIVPSKLEHAGASLEAVDRWADDCLAIVA